MKKFFTLVVLALLAVGCTVEYDDTGLKDLINGLDVRISKLEGDISALQSAIGDGKFVRKVEEYKDPDTGRTTGITVTYTDGNIVHFNIVPVDPTEGPVLSVIRNGAGQLLWAVDGVAVKVDDEEVPVYQTPVFSIDEDGNLWVEVNGKKTNLGLVVSEDATGGATLQDGIFTDLAVTDEAVVLTLSDGTTVNVPFAEAFKLNIATTEFEYETMDPITIPYTVSAMTSGTVVGVSGYNPKSFKVEVDDENIVITPLTLTESAVLLAYADSKVGLTSFVNIVIEALGVEEGPKNLGRKETANCYIVNEAGEYKFPLVKGNGEETVAAASVEVLWETWNNTEDVVQNSVIASVALVDGFVTFTTPDQLKPGNAVIAAKDASGVILWSWHIWVPATAIETADYGIFSAPMMDRNLGALVVATADENIVVESFGLTYQWGRKDPFPGAGTIGDDDDNATVAGLALTATEGAGDADECKISLEQSIQNPTLLGHAKGADWLLPFDNTLWQNDVKTIYDPCPPGYRVPARDKNQPWHSSDLTAVTGWAESDNWFTLGNPVTVFPFAGYRDDYSPDAVCHAYDRAFCWTSYSSASDGSTAYYVNVRKGSAHKLAEAGKSRAGSVRCVVEVTE